MKAHCGSLIVAYSFKMYPISSLRSNKKRLIQGSVLIGAAGCGYYVYEKHKKNILKRAREKNGEEKRGGDRKHRKGRRNSLSPIASMLMRIVGKDKLLVLLGLTLAKTILSNRLSKLQGYLFRAAFLRRVPLFVRNIGENILLCGVAAAMEASAKKWVSKIELVW